MSQENQIQLQHLPPEILTRIFALLSFRQRIRLECICRVWRQAALALAWREVRTLKVTKRVKNPQCSRPSRSLGKLSAILRRCGPNLEELHLGPGIGVQTRFGRYFRHLAPHQKLAHLRIDDRLDVWHLQQIAQHLAHQLISLSLNLFSQKKLKPNANKFNIKMAWAALLSNCQKLECLRISEIGDLFMEDQGQGQLICLVPKTVKYLQIWHKTYSGKIIGLHDKFHFLLDEENFPKMRFFTTNLQIGIEEMLGMKSQQIYERFYSLQWPMLFAPNHSFLQLNFPHFRQLQTLQLNCNIDHDGLTELAEYCPQLEHLDFQANYAAGWGLKAPMRKLEGLYAFRRLSSLALSIELKHFTDFHELSCDTDEFADDVLMEIITNLNQIHPLRSLDFKACIRNYAYYPNFYEEFVLEMLQKLSHLETFSCAIEPHERSCLNGNYRIDLEEFFSKLQNILEEQMQSILAIKRNKAFKFTLLEFESMGRPSYVGLGDSRQKPFDTIYAKWNPNLGKICWKNIPTIPNLFDYQIYLANSIVLDEFLGKVIDKRTKRIFFELID